MADALMPIEQIVTKIYSIRNQTVMLDRDLAELYEVETRTLKQAVRRNRSSQMILCLDKPMKSFMT